MKTNTEKKAPRSESISSEVVPSPDCTSLGTPIDTKAVCGAERCIHHLPPGSCIRREHRELGLKKGVLTLLKIHQ